MSGAEIRRIRMSLRLTQREFAEKIGVHANTVARWERGELGIRRSIQQLLRFVSQEPRLPVNARHR